jgi:CheY-like chemotaxis protein
MKKVLICEDDQAVADVMKIMLDDAGFDTKIVLSGKAIKKKVLNFLPNLILLDVLMPGVDGKEITKILKRDSQTKHIPIILVSAITDLSKIANDVGADGFLAKPFEIDDLISKVKKFAK